MSTIPDAAFTTMAPDWVAEIVSPSTEAVDRGEKMTIYAREHGDVCVRAEPFDAIELDLTLLWASLPPVKTEG